MKRQAGLVVEAVTDLELVRAVRNRSHAAFEQLVERYQISVASMSYALTGSRQASEEIVQEAFLIVWRQLHELKRDDCFRSWLWGIVRNLCSQVRREQQKHAAGKMMSLMGAADVPSREPSALDHLVTREQEHVLWGALGRISEMYRVPLVLHYRDGYSIEQIADLLELSVPAAKKRLSRGRRQLGGDMTDSTSRTLRGTRPAKALTGAAVLALAAGFSSRATAATPAATVPWAWFGALVGVAVTAGALLHFADGRRARSAHPDDTQTMATTEKIPVPKFAPGFAQGQAGAGAAAAAPAENTGSEDSEPTVLHSFDFENGVLPALVAKGQVVTGPIRFKDPKANNFCLSAIPRPDQPGTTMVEVRAGNGALVQYSDRLFLEFDWWMSEGGHSLKITFYDSTTHSEYAGTSLQEIKGTKSEVHGDWVHAQLRLSSIAVAKKERPAMGKGDALTSLSIQAGQPDGLPLYVDNIKILQYPQNRNMPLTAAAVPFGEDRHPWDLDAYNTLMSTLNLPRYESR